MQNVKDARSVLDAVASNPKTAAAVAFGTTSIGAASRLEVIQGWLSVASMCIGIVTACIVAGIQLIRLEMALRERKKASEE